VAPDRKKAQLQIAETSMMLQTLNEMYYNSSSSSNNRASLTLSITLHWFLLSTCDSPYDDMQDDSEVDSPLGMNATTSNGTDNRERAVPHCKGGNLRRQSEAAKCC
jgi:hypothetical protein